MDSIIRVNLVFFVCDHTFEMEISTIKDRFK